MTETTWDTDEAERWISNLEPLYNAAGRVRDARALRSVFEECYPADDFHHSQRVDLDEVDWEHLFTEINEED